MAKPRVFVSSTYYDLKHIRASLDIFVDSLGYEPVLSEKGDIAYTHDRALDESCYREAENADVFVLIVGGRYGSEASGADKKLGRTFFERYDSITKKEYESAANRDIPIYILIEKGVNSEYQTFLRNKDKTDISYAHVESVNVFHLIEEILLKPRNNPIQTFEKFEEIETWLREQWAGLFRELLRRQSQQQQLAGLTTQVTDLKETNETLKKYLEAMMTGSGRQENSRLIESEEKRLEEIRRLDKLRSNRWVRHCIERYGTPFEEVAKAVESCTDAESFSNLLSKGVIDGKIEPLTMLRRSEAAQRDLNQARKILDLAPITFPARASDEDDIWQTRLPVSTAIAIRSEEPLENENISPTSATRRKAVGTKKPASAKKSVTVKKAAARRVATNKPSEKGRSVASKRQASAK